MFKKEEYSLTHLLDMGIYILCIYPCLRVMEIERALRVKLTNFINGHLYQNGHVLVKMCS